MNKDDQFDRLLRQAARPRDDGRRQSECLDPETLAGWTDGTLSAAQLAAAQAHAADCERCLALLAAMARTAPPPSAPQSSRWWSLRWVAPLTTAAVAITAWVVIQQSPPDRPELPPVPETTVTEAPKPAESPATADSAPTAKTMSEPVEKKEAPPAPPAGRAEKPSVLREQTGAAPPSPPADARADTSQTTSVARFAAQAPIVIASPDPNIRWRIVSRRIEHSADAGLTWTVQRGEAEGDLLAGAAADTGVCWIVGRMGIVLLTTDGATWRRVEFPDPTATLVRVAAASALDTTVSTSDGRTYRTTDGGRTWTLQENPGPAF
ncbi:MAG TPA: YCF48-related protein [Vicinamibacterales bacterium]